MKISNKLIDLIESREVEVVIESFQSGGSLSRKGVYAPVNSKDTMLPFKQESTVVKLAPQQKPAGQFVNGQYVNNSMGRDNGTISAYNKSPREKFMSTIYKVGDVGNGVLTGLVSQPALSAGKLLRPDKYFDGVNSDAALGDAIVNMGGDAMNVLPIAGAIPSAGKGVVKAVSMLPHPLAKMLPEAIAAGEMSEYAKAAALGVANRLAPIAVRTPGVGKLYKDMAYKVAGQSSAQFREIGDIAEALRGKSTPKYTGAFDFSVDSWGTNKAAAAKSAAANRSVLRNYIYGDDRGFDLTDIPTTGLKKYEDMYPGMKKYQMLSDNPAPIDNNQLGALLRRYSDQQSNNGVPLSQSMNTRIHSKGDYEGALKRLTSNNKKVMIGLDGDNPINPIDDVAGHVGFLQRGEVGGYDFKSQDIWKFTPEDYNKKWNMGTYVNKDADIRDKLNAYLKPKMSNLMDKAGKPLILLDQRKVNVGNVANTQRAADRVAELKKMFDAEQTGTKQFMDINGNKL